MCCSEGALQAPPEALHQSKSGYLKYSQPGEGEDLASASRTGVDSTDKASIFLGPPCPPILYLMYYIDIYISKCEAHCLNKIIKVIPKTTYIEVKGQG